MAIPTLDPNAPAFTRRYMNLADPRLGARALHASDEFFAPKERMLDPQPAVFIPGKYDDHGKWMDGWETRRKRTTGYDWCIVKLARPGVIKGLDIDTSHFTGNYPPAASIEGAYVTEGAPTATTQWTEIVPSTSLNGNSHHYVEVSSEKPYTHLRVNIYPDGGIA
ncbi:MAG: allantoicase, partial [Paraburkholderia sp.]|nr:allantoicase [Paraburkholderia sp.]